jgi:hypothetical protein
MSDTAQPFGWAYRHVNDPDMLEYWSVTKNKDIIKGKAANKNYIVEELWDAWPSAPAPAPATESVTVPPVHTLREEAAMRIMAALTVTPIANATWEHDALSAIDAADALIKALEEKQ